MARAMPRRLSQLARSDSGVLRRRIEGGASERRDRGCFNVMIEIGPVVDDDGSAMLAALFATTGR
jgi:hypothetical protein